MQPKQERYLPLEQRVEMRQLALPALGLALLLGCSPVFDEISDSALGHFAMYQAQCYFGPVKISSIVQTDPATLTQTCYARNIAGCNKHNLIVINEELPTDIKCQAIMHEIAHSAAWRDSRDWDYEHDDYPDYYTYWLFRACERFGDYLLDPSSLTCYSEET